MAYLKVLKASLVEKREVRFDKPAVPALVEEEFLVIRDKVLGSSERSVTMSDIDPVSVPMGGPGVTNEGSRWVAITEVQSTSEAEQSVEDEAKDCFHILFGNLNSISVFAQPSDSSPSDCLQKRGLDYSHCTNINLFISSMNFFARVNAVYTTFFGSNPPARACVAVDLPAPHRIKLDCLAYAERTPQDRYALHVQGLSYWAPANIGPYSQAVVVNALTFTS